MDAKQFNINGTSVLLKDEQARNRIAAVEGKLPSDASSSNKLITKTVDDLVNYYLKSETYTKSEVEALIGAIQHFHYEVYASTSAVTNPSANVLYLIGPSGTGTDKYEEYVYDATKQSPWIKIGDTSIDLSDYATISAMNTALAEKQDVIADLVTIRANATSAYQKPSGGIPKSDLEQGVKDSLDLADTALQSSPVGQVSPSVDPYEYATRAELEELGQKVDDLSTGKYYGYFASASELPDDADVDGFAYVGGGPTYTVYNLRSGVWVSSGITVNQSPIGNEDDIDQDSNGKLQFANRVYDSQNPDGMGYKILRKNASFASQVTEANTVYEIRYTFSLDADKTLPAGIVLLFNGGEINGNGILTFVETKILGNAKITCGIAGTIFGDVHAEWFGMVSGDSSFDNGPIIEKVCSVFTSVIIGAGDYYCSTPIDLTNKTLKAFFVYGYLYYVTANTSNVFITISADKVVRIYGRIVGPVENNTGGADRSIGICFKDCNGANVFVNDVRFFYTNVQILGSSDGVGNAYNKYEFSYLVAANVLLELKAEPSGWVSSNRITCGRMTSFGGYTRVETAVLIHADTVGFSDVVFEKLTIEGISNSEPIKITNAHNMAILNIRNENNYSPFIYANVAKNIRISSNYGNVTVRTEKGKDCYINEDMDFAPYNPMENAIFIPGGSTKKLLFNAINPSKEQVINYNPGSYIPIGFITPANRRPIRFSCSVPFSLTVLYYDNSLTPIDRDDEYMPGGRIAFQNSSVSSRGYLTSSRLSTQNVAFPTLPAGCAYIGFFFSVERSKTAYNGDCPIFSIPAELAAQIVRTVFTLGAFTPNNKSGTTAQRPVFSEDYRQYLVGYEYFDTTLGKPVFASAIASDGTATWVDATGATV